MDRREYRNLDKSEWGPGEWQDEPDKVRWQDETTGYACLIVRNPSLGHWCGYVGVPETHVLYGQPPDIDDVEELEAHGGVNYAAKCWAEPTDEGFGVCHVPGEGETDHVWWFGFDCAHGGDMSPGIHSVLKGLPPLPGRGYEVYRNMAYLTERVTDLATQLKAIERGKG